MERSKVVDWIWFGAWTVSKPDLSLSVSMLPYHHQYYVYSMIMASDKCICFVFSLRLFGLVLIPLFLYRLHILFGSVWMQALLCQMISFRLASWGRDSGIHQSWCDDRIYLPCDEFLIQNFFGFSCSIVGATLLLPCVHLEIKDTKFILC